MVLCVWGVNMKRMLTVFCLFLICLTVFLCCQNAGKSNNAVIDIGKSTKFSNKEIQSAADCVKNKFRDFKGCKLTKLWYDEKSSEKQVEGYISNGKGSKNGAKSENVIVLLSDFNVDSSGGDGGFNPNSTYNDWCWILIRDSKTGDWKVDDWGY